MSLGNAIVGQSGGPTSVINASLAGVVETALKSKKIGRVLGMRFGIEGVLNNFLLDLGNESPQTIKALKTTPSSALGSSRLKLKEEHFEPIVKQLKKYDIRYFFMIGGNDTMDTIHRIVEHAVRSWLRVDRRGHLQNGGQRPGRHRPHAGLSQSPPAMSPSACSRAGLLARDMQRVDQFVIFQTVGRSAGWLPAAAACAKRSPADAPHIILLPERPFQRDKFLEAVATAHKKYGFVSIVTGEGVTNPDGSPVSASQTRDKFDNIEFGAMGGTSAAMMLHQIISREFGWRGEFQVTESLEMCAADRAVKLDIDEAFGCGRQAVKLAEKGESGVMVTIQRTSKPNEPYRAEFGTIPLAAVANTERPMPDNYITKDGMFVTKAFLNYAQPLVGELPEYANLTIKRAKTLMRQSRNPRSGGSCRRAWINVSAAGSRTLRFWSKSHGPHARKYNQFGLVRDMLATPEIIAGFDTDQATDTAAEIASAGRLLLTGEGSSRIFPAKCAIAHAQKMGWPLAVFTEAGQQAWDYDLSKTAVFAASNSGKTAEVIGLFERLKEQNHPHCLQPDRV